MEEVTVRDRELVRFRHTYYGLFVQLWWREPAADFIASLKEGMGGRMEAAAGVQPLMEKGWRVISDSLTERSAEEVEEEYTRLFLGPFAPQVHPYESYYLTGGLFKAPLVALRGFLQALGLERRREEFAEPEDILPFELEVMRWLIGKQSTATETEEESRWLRHQTEFLRQHLLVWAPACAQDIERAQGAYFYRGAAMLLRGFLELEKALFRDWGLDRLPSLEEARQRYGFRPTWKGPTVDFASDEPEEPPSRRDK